MDATQRKELLHLRIEQANEEMQIVLAKMVEALFQTYQPEVMQEKLTDEVIVELRTPQMSAEEYEESLKPMTRAELIARAEASNEDIAAGRIYSAEEVDKMFAT